MGLAAVQIGSAYGLKVIGTAGSQEGLTVVKESGAHEVFNHKEPGYMDKILVSFLKFGYSSHAAPKLIRRFFSESLQESRC